MAMPREQFLDTYELLSPRLKEVLNLVGEGNTNKEIAHLLERRDGSGHLSEATTKGYVEELMRLFDTHTRSELAALWGRYGAG